MNQQDEKQTAPARKGRSDRWVKLAFLVAVAAIGVFVWLSYRTPPLRGFSGDLEKALEKAKAEGRNIVLLFINSPASDNDRFVMQKIIAKRHNLQALEKGNYLCVRKSTSLRSEMAKRYQLKELPTVLLLGPDGRELNRRQGRGGFGEIEFRKGFLDCKEIRKP